MVVKYFIHNDENVFTLLLWEINDEKRNGLDIKRFE